MNILSTVLRHQCFFVLIFFNTWHINAQTKPQNSKDKLVVSFISIGTGIDYKAKDKLNLLVEDFQREHLVQLGVSFKYWGREGETDYTYDLTKLSKKQCKAFIKKIEEMFAGNNRVKISHSSLD